MKYEIHGTTMPVVECTLDKGENILCQLGAMKYMDGGLTMKTRAAGGLGGMLKRGLTGESLFLNTYTATEGGQRIAFGHTLPGKIIPVDVTAAAIVCQRRAFLASESTVELQIAFQRRLSTGFFGGEGFIMQRLAGQGLAMVELDGEIIEHTLAPGQKLRVETGAVGMFESSVQMDIEMIKGFSNMMFGGEGLFLTTLTGPGRVWLQTMSIQTLAAELQPYLHTGGKS